MLSGGPGHATRRPGGSYDAACRSVAPDRPDPAPPAQADHRGQSGRGARSVGAHGLSRHGGPARERRAGRGRGRHRLRAARGLRPAAADVHDRGDRGGGARRADGRQDGRCAARPRGGGCGRQDRAGPAGGASRRARPHRPVRARFRRRGADRPRAGPRRERKLAIAYRDGAGRATERRIWPLLVAFLGDAALIGAWCELRRDFRTFRADRIASIAPLDERFDGKRGALRRDYLATIDGTD